MENTSWEHKLHALTHILTSPTTTPSLYSQFFIATQIPCYPNWDYPPLLCNNTNHHSNPFLSPHLKWGLSFFLKRLSNLVLPKTSWRSKCPYQQPPPLVLARGVEEAQWGDEQIRAYARKRIMRKKLELNINPLIPSMVPNVLIFVLWLWNPFPFPDPNS